MRCGEARRRLWPDEGPRAATPEIDAAQIHVAECEPCRRFIGEMRWVAEEIAGLAPRPAAPPAVRDRVLRAVPQARARGTSVVERGRRRAWVGVGVIVAVGAGAALWVAQQRPSDRAWWNPIAAVAEDHVRALSDDGIASSDPAAVADYLGGRVPFAVSVPLIPDATLEGGRLCFLSGRRGVALRYRVDGKVVSYYVMPEPADGRPDPDPRLFHHGSGAGYNVIAWRDAGLFHAFVSDLPVGRLSQLARLSARRSSS